LAKAVVACVPRRESSKAAPLLYQVPENGWSGPGNNRVLRIYIAN
jgi:hypothetical protein